MGTSNCPDTLWSECLDNAGCFVFHHVESEWTDWIRLERESNLGSSHAPMVTHQLSAGASASLFTNGVAPSYTGSMPSHFWPWLLVIAAYFYGIIYI